jgi:hypothetical protein
MSNPNLSIKGWSWRDAYLCGLTLEFSRRQKAQLFDGRLE